MGKVTYKAFEGARLSDIEYDAIIAKGCCWCGDKIEQNRNNPLPLAPVAWIASDMVACNSCTYDTHDLVAELPKPLPVIKDNRKVKKQERKRKQTLSVKEPMITVVKGGKVTVKGGIPQHEIEQIAARSTN